MKKALLLLLPFFLFAEESISKEMIKTSPKKLIVETKKDKAMDNVGFAYQSESVGRFNHQDSDLGNVMSGFSGNAYYSHPVWKEGKKAAKVNMGGSLAMVGADVVDFQDMAGSTAGAQFGIKMEDGKGETLLTSMGIDFFQSVYDSKSRSSTGVKMHYGVKF